MTAHTQKFTTKAVTDARGRVLVPLPFTPDDAWGTKPVHSVNGTVNGTAVRGKVEPLDDGWGLLLGPAWRRDNGVRSHETVEVVLVPEGPQRDDLPDDVASALASEPAAGSFFDGLAQFYRKAYLRWIAGTQHRPVERAKRIAEMMQLLEAGMKERPR